MMPSFGDYLQRAKRVEDTVNWSAYYISYNMLKRTLVSYKDRRINLLNTMDERVGEKFISEAELEIILRSFPRFLYANDHPNTSKNDHFNYTDFPDESKITRKDAMDRLADLEKADFYSLLNEELEKASGFCSSLLMTLKEEIKKSSQDKNKLRFIANEILHTYSFAVVNVITLRQILIRYDAFTRTYEGTTLSKIRLKKGVVIDNIQLGTNNYVVDLFELETLDGLAEEFINMTSYNPSLHAGNESEKKKLFKLDSFESRLESFRQLLDKTMHSVKMTVKKKTIMRDKFVTILRKIRYYFLLVSGVNSLGLESSLFLMRGRHLKEEIESIALWMESNKDLEGTDDVASEYTNLDPENILPLILNLLSCFIYMMNNYIIEPSSAYYANALGSNDAMSGLMLSMSPWFALMSAVGYSYWTNHSYRSPILFGGVLMTIGNFLYGMAYSYNSMKMCLIGRAFTGLGAPRIINRRYVADSTPFCLRTAASAAFAMATALGAALGPGVAILLDYADFDFSIPFFGKQQFNGMTGPGFFMALVWLLYTICIYYKFEEPKRSGLEELKKREKKEEDVEIPDHLDVLSDDFTITDSISFQSPPETKKSSSMCGCLRHITRPVVLTMSLVFMKRIALENIVGATSIVTKNRYGWNIRNVGTLHLVNGVIVIPVSVLAGWLSQYYLDRHLAIVFLSVTFCGLLFLLDISDLMSSESEHYNEGNWLAVDSTRYIIGSLIAFSGIEAGESFVVSLMSKVVPSALASGVFNSGLLATLVGTSGRATGDIIITCLGLISIRNLLNLLIIPSIVLVATSIIWIRIEYDSLAL